MNTLPTPAAPASPKHMHFDGSRWCIGDRELHCGDCFDLYPDRNDLPPIEVRIEHGAAGWYLLTPYGIMQPSKRRASL